MPAPESCRAGSRQAHNLRAALRVIAGSKAAGACSFSSRSKYNRDRAIRPLRERARAVVGLAIVASNLQAADA